MDNGLAQTIGASARAARLARSLTQQDAAERIGISMEFYSRIERGLTLPSVPTLLRISRALGVTTDALVGANQRLASPGPISAVRSSDRPEIRRLMRRLNDASPRTIRLLNLLAAALKAADRRQKKKRQP